MLYYLCNLFANEEEVADANTKLHYPDADINQYLPFLSKYLKAQLRITVYRGVSLCNLQNLKHCVTIKSTNDTEHKDTTDQASEHKSVWN